MLSKYAWSVSFSASALVQSCWTELTRCCSAIPLSVRDVGIVVSNTPASPLWNDRISLSSQWPLHHRGYSLDQALLFHDIGRRRLRGRRLSRQHEPLYTSHSVPMRSGRQTRDSSPVCPGTQTPTCLWSRVRWQGPRRRRSLVSIIIHFCLASTKLHDVHTI